MLRRHLIKLSEEQPGRAFAILCPEPDDPSVWKLVWSSHPGTSERYQGRLSSHPEVIDWPGQPEAVGIALISKLQPLAVVAWPHSTMVTVEELTQTLETCRELYWEESESKWMHILLTLLSALKDQRREVGTAIHRGPAQALTAARLELSMMGEGALEAPIAQALEQASEELVRLVHGKLRGRRQDGSLAATLRGELNFQARWRDLPINDGTVTLPKEALSGALADLWKLTGGVVRESGDESTFVLGAAK